MGEFSVFARDFEVPLNKSEVAKIFKKVADFRKKPLYRKVNRRTNARAI